MALPGDVVRKEGIRLIAMLAIGFVAGTVLATGQCGIWPATAADRIAAAGIVVNVFFGAATVAVAIVAYRLGARDALERAESKKNSADIAAGLLFTTVVAIQYLAEQIIILAQAVTRPEGTAHKAILYRRITAQLRRSIGEIDNAHIAQLALGERDLAMTLAYALGRVRSLPDLADKEAERLEHGAPGTQDARHRLAESANASARLCDGFLKYCDKFATSINVRDAGAAGAGSVDITT